MSSIAETDGAPGVRLGLLMQRVPGRERPFGALTPFAETLSTLARFEDVAVEAFGPDDLDLASGRVTSWRFLGPARGWTEGECTLPDVLWNRYFRKDQEALLRTLRQQGVPFLNAPGLNKWEAHQSLLAEPACAPHLPATRLLEDVFTVTEMLDQHPVLYIKPVSGAVGRGIIRVEREARGLMRLQYVSSETGQVRAVYAGDQQLARWLRDRRRQGRFIVQQGLELMVFHGRPADVRVLVQKDGSGRWGVTGMGARVAAHGRFTANLHTGGHGVPVELLAEAVFPEDPHGRRALQCDLEALALAAAHRVDLATGGMGEVGLDFGVDPSGQIWLIEQNAQPGRALFEHLGRFDQFDLAHLRPVQYARFLAEQKTARVACTGAT